MRKLLTDEVRLSAVAINYKEGDKLKAIIKLIDKDGKEHIKEGIPIEVDSKNIVRTKRFTTESMAEELKINPNDIVEVRGWIDEDGNGVYDRDYEEECSFKIIKNNLTIFLGGAGMRGNYQYDFIKALENAGISNIQRGNYSALFHGTDEEYNEFVDMGADASSVIFYNQDTNDPIALQLVDTRGCKVGTEIEFLNMKYRSYEGKTIKNEECPSTFRYELDIPSNIEFSLKNIQISNSIPKNGQFNFIGYSWGSIVASRTALKYANDGEVIDNLVLIGAPINYSLLQSVQSHSNIKNIIIINLTQYGDPIYAGMTDAEILSNASKLGLQMTKETGHFYYSVESEEGRNRRKKLAKELYEKGLR